MLLYIAIIAYITSVVIALIFFFAIKNLNPVFFRIAAATHFIFALLFIFNLVTTKGESPYYLSFLLFICTGVVCLGLAFGTKAIIPFKIYFSVFAISLALFLMSPSTLFNFLMTASFNSGGEEPIHVKGKMYLEREGNSFNKDGDVLYKLTKKQGIFHKTISRDLNFNGKLDSVKLISFDESRLAAIRGYTSKKTFVSDEVDSTDVAVDLNPKKKDVIERKL